MKLVYTHTSCDINIPFFRSTRISNTDTSKILSEVSTVLTVSIFVILCNLTIKLFKDEHEFVVSIKPLMAVPMLAAAIIDGECIEKLKSATTTKKYNY